MRTSPATGHVPTEYPTVHVALTWIDAVEGKSHTVLYAYVGSDHAESVKKMAESLIPQGCRVHSIESFDGPPRRWRWDIDVTELP